MVPAGTIPLSIQDIKIICSLVAEQGSKSFGNLKVINLHETFTSVFWMRTDINADPDPTF
jgi:hypothetical protein